VTSGPHNIDPHCGVLSRPIFLGPAHEKRGDGPVIAAASL
jgi:hypothetical protein